MNFPNPRYDMCRRRKGGRCTKGTAGNVTVYFADGKLLCRRAPPSLAACIGNLLAAPEKYKMPFIHNLTPNYDLWHTVLENMLCYIICYVVVRIEK